jgi:CDP-glucose 4,6-dehydratase
VEGVGLNPISPYWNGRRVLLTGHTGFVGAWLGLWLESMGADVTGFGLAPDTTPSLFEALSVGSGLKSRIGDIRDVRAVELVVDTARPEVVIHLAAQALVRRSYKEPVDTWSTNVMGTVHLCQALRKADDLQAVVVVTSDKTYLNSEDGRPFDEDAPLGGHDPYSASKAAEEMVAAAWSHSFLRERQVALATARAGNLLGGGDWAEDRLVPDLWRSLQAGDEVRLRNPHATRPWLHVLDAATGYLMLAERLANLGPFGAPSAINFGPAPGQKLTVADLAGRVLKALGQPDTWRADDSLAPPEKRVLALDATRAQRDLGWKPMLEMDEAVQWAVQWYRAHDSGEDMRAFTLRQIEDFEIRL